MSSLIYIVIMGLLNALRGGLAKEITISQKIDTRPMWMACMAIATGGLLFHLTYEPLISLGVCMLTLFLAFLVSFSFGWGKYFNAAFPDMKYVSETEVKIIDVITTKIYKDPTDKKEFERWCLIAMSLRGLLFYPVFIILSFANPWALLFGFGMALMGPIYFARRIFPETKSIRVAEFTTGCLLGGLICLSLTI